VGGQQPARAVERALPARAGSEQEREKLFAGERGRPRANEPFPRTLFERQIANAKTGVQRPVLSEAKDLWLFRERLARCLGLRPRNDIKNNRGVGSPVRTLLMVAGLVLLLMAILWPIVSKYFGRLPGDIVVRRPGFTFVFPIVTCLVLSLLLSLLFWIFRR
jgi:hypothetical protein